MRLNEVENHLLPDETNDSWRTWLMTGARKTPLDPRRLQGSHRGLKKILAEGLASNGAESPYTWKDFSGAMVRHAVDDAMRSLPTQDKQVVKLAYFGGYSNREIAVQTGLTEATVQRRLRRALATISEHIQRGRALGRKVAYAMALWLSARWLSDAMAHLAPAATVAAVTVIVVAQPAVTSPGVPSAPPAARATTSSTPQPVIPPLPSPTAPVNKLPSAAAPAAPAAPRVPVSTPVVKLPVALPKPPVKIPLRP